jgi:hypothetical protein
MPPPYEYLFLGLLGAYMVYSVWARLDSRYPIAGALVLLVVAAITDAAGATAAANTLAVYVFFLLAGGVVLLLLDHVRDERRLPPAEPTESDRGDGVAGEKPSEPSDQRDAPTQGSLDRLKQ